MPFVAGLLCAKCITYTIANIAEGNVAVTVEKEREAQRACIPHPGPSSY